MEAGAYLQQRGDPTFDFYGPGGGGGDAAEDLEQGTFSRPVMADDP
jgi:hypothetical protein